MQAQNKTFKLGLAVAALVALSAVGSNAYAADATGTMAVTAEVQASCTISTTPVAFGAYDPVVTNASTPLDANGSVSTTCTKGAPVTIKLDLGLNADTGTVRQMLGATNAELLPYELYTEDTHTTVWDTATGVSYTGTGVVDTRTVYGRVPAGTLVSVDTYSDTVTATVTF